MIYDIEYGSYGSRNTYTVGAVSIEDALSCFYASMFGPTTVYAVREVPGLKPLTSEQARQLSAVSADVRRLAIHSPSIYYVEKDSGLDIFLAVMISLGFSTAETAPLRILSDVDSWLLDQID